MTGATVARRLSPWWSPWGLAARLASTVRSPADLVWFPRIGWFVFRLPTDLEQSHLSEFMTRLAREPRPRAAAVGLAAERVVRLRTPWLRLPLLRRRDTCYVRALTLFRFLDAAGHDVRFRVAAEWFDRPGGVLRGHAWVTVDGRTIEAPSGADDHSRLQPIELVRRGP